MEKMHVTQYSWFMEPIPSLHTNFDIDWSEVHEIQMDMYGVCNLARHNIKTWTRRYIDLLIAGISIIP